MRIRCNHERTGDHISPLHHDLVSNARSGRIEVHALLFGERFNRAVLLLVRFILILDVMVECEHELLRVLHLLCADTLELAHHCRRVVMRHTAMRTNRQEIPCPKRPRWPFGHVSLRDFFNDGLTHGDSRYSFIPHTKAQPTPAVQTSAARQGFVPAARSRASPGWTAEGGCPYLVLADFVLT